MEIKFSIELGASGYLDTRAFISEVTSTMGVSTTYYSNYQDDKIALAHGKVTISFIGKSDSIAQDNVVVVVNKNATNLSRSQIKKIFKGSSTRWPNEFKLISEFIWIRELLYSYY